VFVYASSSLQSYEVAHYHNSFIGNQADTRSLTLVNEGALGYFFLAVLLSAGGAFCYDFIKFKGEILSLHSLEISERGEWGR